jgi:hypothetical protein
LQEKFLDLDHDLDLFIHTLRCELARVNPITRDEVNGFLIDVKHFVTEFGQETSISKK